MNEFCIWYLKQLADFGNFIKNGDEIPTELRVRLMHASSLPELFTDEMKTTLQECHHAIMDVAPDQVKVFMQREYGSIFYAGWQADETHMRVGGIDGRELYLELEGRTWTVKQRLQA